MQAIQDTQVMLALLAPLAMQNRQDRQAGDGGMQGCRDGGMEGCRAGKAEPNQERGSGFPALSRLCRYGARNPLHTPMPDTNRVGVLTPNGAPQPSP